MKEKVDPQNSELEELKLMRNRLNFILDKDARKLSVAFKNAYKMKISYLLAEHAAKYSVLLENKDIPIDLEEFKKEEKQSSKLLDLMFFDKLILVYGLAAFRDKLMELKMAELFGGNNAVQNLTLSPKTIQSTGPKPR